jgi:small subunit ribosomal protein S16
MKRLGRKGRPFYRLCVLDGRTRRDGPVLEEVGHYDPMVSDPDARAIIRGDRIDYWLGVGAQPSERATVLIKKYGTNGTHLAQQQAALQKLGRLKKAPPAAAAKA